VFALKDGRVLDENSVLAERAGARLLDVAATSDGIAFSYTELEQLVVEYRPTDGAWRDVIRVDAGPDRVGGAIALEDDGILWIGVGDGGTESDARDPSSLRGSLLRIDVGEVPYSVPADNPYADDPTRRAEVWAFGLRNPARCALSGDDVWCSDIGETYVELNRAVRRADYGWPYADGPGCRQGTCPQDQTAPVAFRRREDECGLLPGPPMPASIPDSADVRIYAGICNGRLFGVRSREDGVRQKRRIGVAAGMPVGLTALDDAVVTLDADGNEQRWTFTDDLNAFPRTLAASGCLTDSGKFAPSLLPYDVAAPLWTDGAAKERFIALPVGEAIRMANDGTPQFPDGTAILKMFSRELSDGSVLPIETRVMRARDGAWDFYTYVWEDGSADLLSGGKDVFVESPADSQAYEHHVPTRAACQSCHRDGKRVLGPVGPQLDRAIDLDGRQAPQLELFRQAGVLEGNSAGDPLVDPFEDSAPTDRRARSYLHANCAHCHRPGGWAPASLVMDLRYETSLPGMGVCGVPAEFGTIWADGDVRIDPGHPENSNLLQRILVDNMGRMPPIGTTVPDRRGAAVVREWIDALETCER
jgi:uncharacterized repeat protein (TIGR03806 family)